MVDLVLHLRRGGDHLQIGADIADDVAGAHLLRGGAALRHSGDDDALDAVVQFEALAQFGRNFSQFQVQHRHRRAALPALPGIAGGCGHADIFRQLAQHHLPDDPLALAPDIDPDVLARQRFGNRARQVTRLLDVLAVEAQDHVADLDPGLGRGVALEHLGDQCAARPVEREPLRDLVGDALDPDPEPAAPGAAEFAKLVDHRLGEVRRDREPDADAAARRREDGGVDADQLALHIEKRSAGIAAVDRRVGLDEIVIGAGVDVAMMRRNDARAHAAAEPERVPDRQHPVTDAGCVRIAELDRRQRRRRFDPEHGDIGLGVASHHLRLEPGPVLQDDDDLVGLGNDVVVGHDQPRSIDDEAGTE